MIKVNIEIMHSIYQLDELALSKQVTINFLELLNWNYQQHHTLVV